MWRSNYEVLGLVDAGEAGSDGTGYVLDPAVLDGCFQAAGELIDIEAHEGALILPAHAELVRVHDRIPRRVWCHIRRQGASGHDIRMDLDVLTESGEQLVTIRGLSFRSVPRSAMADLAGARLRRYEITWRPLPQTAEIAEAPGEPTVSQTAGWLVFGADAGLARDWQARLADHGNPAIALLPRPPAYPAVAGTLVADPESDEAVRDLFDGMRATGTRLAGLIVHAGVDSDPGRAAGSCCQRHEAGIHAAKALPAHLRGRQP